jgi:tripartite-type tricarboxylate transporter receptor subunit TctC
MVLNTMTMSNVGYDPVRDFVPIAIFAVSTTSIAVHPSVPATDVKELLAYVKANTGKLSYGSAGAGTMSHLSGELFKLRTGMTDVVHVPYKGAGPGVADLVSGHIPMMSPNINGQLLQFHQAGKIRILAINSKQRLKAAPDIPTAIEQGVPDMVGELFLGIYAPSATPKTAVDAMSEATRKAVDNPEFEKILIASGFEPAPYFTADSARRYMAEEFERWKPVVAAIGLKTN